MSTKIWTAYKLKDPTQLWPFVHDIRIQATKNIQIELRKLYADISGAVNCDSEEYKQARETVEKFTPTYVDKLSEEEKDWRARIDVAERIIKKGYREASNSMILDYFDFDVSVAFREWKGDIYIIPHCNMVMRKVLDFLKDDNRLVDFHYQNQTDRPKKISGREWKKRERVWDGMLDNGLWSDVLVLDVCKYEFFWQIDPYMDILQERRDKLSAGRDSVS